MRGIGKLVQATSRRVMGTSGWTRRIRPEIIQGGDKTYTFDLVETFYGAQHFHISSGSGDKVDHDTSTGVVVSDSRSNSVRVFFDRFRQICNG